MRTHRTRAAIPGIVAAFSLAACSQGASPPTSSIADAQFPLETAGFTFQTIDNDSDVTFNQLLGINNSRKISGYFGSGSPGHPNKGYTVVPPFGQSNFTNENFPGAVQTQVTGINGRGQSCGFWIDSKGTNFGFIRWNGVFASYRDPNTGTGTINRILGLNDSGIAVGYYTDGSGVDHGFTLNRATGKFTPVRPPGASNVTATGINDNGDVVGLYASANQVAGFLRRAGKFSSFTIPNSIGMTPSGVNITDDIAGSFTDFGGASHGFLLKPPLSHPVLKVFDDPNGRGTTVVNGVNDDLYMVGFYIDSTGNTNGMLISP